MKMITNLGQVVGLILANARAEEQGYEDAEAFHAPSECYPLIRRGHARHARLLRRRIRALTRCSRGQLMRQLDRRCSRKWLYITGASHELFELLYGYKGPRS